MLFTSKICSHPPDCSMISPFFKKNPAAVSVDKLEGVRFPNVVKLRSVPLLIARSAFLLSDVTKSVITIPRNPHSSLRTVFINSSRSPAHVQINGISHHIFIKILASTIPQHPHFSVHIFSMNFDQMVPAPTNQ